MISKSVFIKKKRIMEGKNVKTLLNITIDENHKVNIDCPDYTLLSTALSIQLGFDYFQNNKKELFHSLFFVLMNVVSMDESGLLEKRFIEVFKKDVTEFRKENERIFKEAIKNS